MVQEREQKKPAETAFGSSYIICSTEILLKSNQSEL